MWTEWEPLVAVPSNVSDRVLMWAQKLKVFLSWVLSALFSLSCSVSLTRLSFFVTGNYVLNYLATRPKLAAFVTQALIQLYARITKLGWFDCQKDDYVFRNVIADVTRFLQVRMSFYRVIQTLLLRCFLFLLFIFLYATVSLMCIWCVYRIVLSTAS